MIGFRPCTISAFRRVAALTCVASYLLGGTELLPQVLALGAWIEGSHSVRLARDERGVTVVLSHDRNVAACANSSGRQTANPLHRHGVAARLFCLFATPATATPDHIANFAGMVTCERSGASAKIARVVTQVTDAGLTPVLLHAANLPPRLYSSEPPRVLPMISSAALLGIRSTVLVI